jgi:hypothetical protein
MITDSQFSRNLNAELNQPGATPDSVWNFFVASVTPFGIPAADLTRAAFEPLWFDGTNLQTQSDSSPKSVGAALSPPLVYFPGPCPDGILVNDLMARLP